MKINLEKELVRLCIRNKDGSFSAQANRKAILSLAARDLKNLGVYNLSPQGIKPKHVEKLLNYWKEQGKSAGTLKNRMSHLRRWAEKVNKASVIARDNAHYGIDRRKYVTNISKSVQITGNQLKKIKDARLRCSVELQRAFGLRREECLKFQPDYAIQKDHIRLKQSWTKGGKARTIPIRTEYQREVLARAAILANTGSMIPSELRYVDQLNKYTNAISSAGMSKLHGLRHEYAQNRYLELTGRECPAKGGKVSKNLDAVEKKLDYEARMIVSKELGHERESITAVYLGR